MDQNPVVESRVGLASPIARLKIVLARVECPICQFLSDIWGLKIFEPANTLKHKKNG
jgi:hypothetical protein